MSFTLAQAAAETGLHRSSILRAIKRGAVSGSREAGGQWSIEPAELFRATPGADEHLRWSKRDLCAKRYVYFWADGIHVQARLEERCAVPAGHHWCHPGGQGKGVVGLIDGVRESAESWREWLPRR